MNRSIVSLLFALMPLVGAAVRTPVAGFFAANDSIFAADTIDNPEKESHRYETSSRHFKHFWHVLTPRRIVVQYAGGIGFMSVGLGWFYGKNKAWETDVLAGFVPPYSTGRAKLTFTVKETYSPFRIALRNNFHYQPLSCGIYLNSIFGHEFWDNEPTRYPKKYYGFSTGIRAGVYLGQRFRLRIPPARRRLFKEIMFYYEAGTCDLYIVSCATNKDISLWDIVNFSCGLKFTVF